MKKFLSVFLLSGFLFFPISSFSQDNIVVLENSVLEDINYSKINEELNEIENSLMSKKIALDLTIEYIRNLDAIHNKILDARTSNEHNLGFVQKRIEALGAAPSAGEKEPKELANKRKEFTSEASKYKSKIAEADLIMAKIEELNNLILSARNKELLGNILNKQEIAVNFWSSTADFIQFCYDIAKSPVSWYQGLNEKSKQEVKDKGIYVGLTMFLSLLLAWYLSFLIKRKFGYRKNIENPDYGKKVSAAVWVSIAHGAIPAAIIGAFLLWLKNVPVIGDEFFRMVIIKSSFYLLYIFLSQAIVKVIFVPQNSKWRLLEVDDEKAASLSHALLFSIIMIAIFSLLQVMAINANYGTDILYYIKTLSNCVKMICIILVARRFLYNVQALEDDAVDEEDDMSELNLSSKISILLSLSSIAVFGMSLFGYVNLAEFIFNRFIYSVVALGSLYIINRFIKVVIHRLLSIKYWTKNLRMSRKGLRSFEIWFILIINPVIFCFSIFILLGLWGMSIDILLQSIRRFLTGFYIGGVKVSIVSIFMGILIFFVSWAVFKALKRSLFSGVLTKIEMDEGVRSSLAAGFGFVGFIISALFAIAVMGGNLGSLAIIAGALSFGAGLGLQNVVSNFVSGIIILFERPMKIGDWVIINGQEGIVKQINIRATELETFTKAHVIIPNADILSSSLINMTYHGKLGRIEVKVGVAYGTDLKKVKQILADIAKGNKKLLNSPAPYVVFSNIGESSLDFEIRGFISDINNKMTVSNDIREEIIYKFADAGIDIPFPQRVIHMAPAKE